MPLYVFLKYCVHLTFLIFFKKIYLHFKTPVSQKGAKIFAVNHPTAFLDPMLMPTILWHTTYFILRGDVFVSPAVIWFLKIIKTIPIFRFRDGFKNLKKNHDTMDYCYELLSEGKNITIMAEGQMAMEKRMRPIQKGTARMVAGTFEKYQLEDISIVPVGVNYTASHEFRSSIMIATGEPIYFKDYLDIYKKNDRRAIKLMTDELSKRMKPLILHVDKPEDDALVNLLLDINRHDFAQKILPVKEKSRTLLDQELAITKKVNEMGEAQKEALKETAKSYQQQLEEHQLQDVALSNLNYYNIKTTLFLILGYPTFMVGFFFNFLPVYFTKYMSDKKVTKIEFYSSVLFGLGMASYMIYFFLWSLFFAIVDVPNVGAIGELLLLFSIPVLGYFALIYYELWDKWRIQGRFRRMDKVLRERLLALRKTLKM